jgi:hypothetical protein
LGVARWARRRRLRRGRDTPSSQAVGHSTGGRVSPNLVFCFLVFFWFFLVWFFPHFFFILSTHHNLPAAERAGGGGVGLRRWGARQRRRWAGGRNTGETDGTTPSLPAAHPKLNSKTCGDQLPAIAVALPSWKKQKQAHLPPQQQIRERWVCDRSLRETEVRHRSVRETWLGQGQVGETWLRGRQGRRWVSSRGGRFAKPDFECS